MQQYTRRNNKQRILDTDYNFNWNAGYGVELLRSTTSREYAGRMENLLRILLRGRVTNDLQAVILYGVNCIR